MPGQPAEPHDPARREQDRRALGRIDARRSARVRQGRGARGRPIGGRRRGTAATGLRLARMRRAVGCSNPCRRACAVAGQGRRAGRSASRRLALGKPPAASAGRRAGLGVPFPAGLPGAAPARLVRGRASIGPRVPSRLPFPSRRRGRSGGAHRLDQRGGGVGGGRGVLDHAAIAHDDHAGGGAQHLLEQVRDEHHGPAMGREAAHVVDELPGPARVERGGGLVQDHEPRRLRGGARQRDLHHLPPTDRELAHQVPRARRRAPGTPRLECVRHERRRPRSPSPAAKASAGLIRAFSSHGEVGAERPLLEDAAHARRPCRGHVVARRHVPSAIGADGPRVELRACPQRRSSAWTCRPRCGPRGPTQVPGSTRKSTRSSARTGPKAWLTPRSSSTGAGRRSWVHQTGSGPAARQSAARRSRRRLHPFDTCESTALPVAAPRCRACRQTVLRRPPPVSCGAPAPEPGPPVPLAAPAAPRSLP